MTIVNQTIKTGPNGRPVRPFVMPSSFTGKLSVWRYLLMRRAMQLGILLLFLGTVRAGWQLAGQPVLSGNLSSSELFGLVPMADPFAVLQIMLTGTLPLLEVLLGAAIILGIYGLIGGRSWCAWVCPVNMVTDLAAWLRRRLGISDMFHLSRNTRYTVLLLTLVLSILTSVAAFEWISPISMLHRELIFGIGLGWTAVLGVFLFDLFILRNGWCGHLCPLGAFYAVVGKLAQVRVRFDTPTCTHCGECARVCPEPQVLNLREAATHNMITSGECSNCGRCITVCPEDTLHFDLRQLINTRSPPRYESPSSKESSMKSIPLLATVGLIIGLTGPAFGDAVDELNMGLSKTSVFDTPTPSTYNYSDAKPGKNEWLPRAWDGIPPQIPHRTGMYLPVIAADNQCLDCHDTPRYIDKPRNMDRSRKNKSPMSPAHYANESLETVAGARFNCTQCHVPLSNAAPLVDNTFR